MKLNSGLPYSLIRYGLPFNYPKLESDIQADVIIIGGGISGALNAFHLTEAGISCVLVDKRTIGLGSTAASTSLLQYEIDVSLNDLIANRGERDARRAYTLTNEAVNKLRLICKQIGFNGFYETESLYFGVFKKDEVRLQRETEMRQRIGLQVQFLDAQKLEGVFHAKTYGAILSSNAAYADAYLLTHALLQHALKKGLRVFDRTEIKTVVEKKGHIAITTSDQRKIKANSVVYASGYEATERIQNQLIQLRSTYATVSESFTEAGVLPFRNTLLWSTSDPYLYLRCTNDNRVIIGGRDDLFLNPGKRDRSIAIKARALVKDFTKLFPSIRFIPEFSWAGTFIKTTDGLPFIGRAQDKTYSYYALGFGGNGIIFSVIAAEIIRDLILGRENEDEKLFRFNRR